MRFKWKVAFALLAGSMLPIAVILNLEIGRLDNFARESAEKAILSQTALKAHAVESYFGGIIALAQSIADRPETAGTLRSFARTAGDIIQREELVPDEAALAARYDAQLNKTEGATVSDRAAWLAGLDDVGKRLQHLYVSSNPEEVGQKEKLDNAGDGSAYSSMHRANHPVFRDVAQRLGFYDVFLIEPAGGRIVYSVEKEVDYGTSLLSGPYAATAFGKAAQTMIAAQAKDMPFLIADFEPYAPSFNQQSAFLLVPVWDGTSFGGILAFQLPLDFAGAMLKAGGEELGGADTYIVGADRRLRSVPDGAEGLGVGSELDSGLMEVAARDSIGVEETTNHGGEVVYAGHRPLDLPGLEWRIVSEISADVVLADAHAAREAALYTGGVVGVCVLILALGLSQWLLMPIRRLGREMQDQTESAVAVLRTAAGQARGAAETMATSAEETSRQSEEVIAGSRMTVQDVTGVATAVEQLSGSISDVTRGIVETSGLVESAAQNAAVARGLLAELETVASRITDIVSLIDDVARQTNLLSLNAAIEASHAGAAGQGFAVVAAEIRKLAARTTQSTEEISDEVQQVLSAVSANADAIRAISERIDQVNEQARSISVAAGEQEEVTSGIAVNMGRTSARVTQASQALEAMHGASSRAAKAAVQMLEGVGQVANATDAVEGALSRFVLRVHRL